eukprot:scaffold29538_cov72-Skeletonema_dohrnii-CCMP3373.AAC.1
MAAAALTSHHQAPAQPVIQSWCQKVVEVHLSLLAELIIFPEGKYTHHLLATTMSLAQLPTRLRPAASYGRYLYPTAAFNSIHPRTLPPHLAA